MKLIIVQVALIAFGISAVVCAHWPKGVTPLASATLVAKSGSNVSGTVDFAKDGSALLIRVYAQNLAPGPHGIHAHEKGDCTAEDASTAGEHFNPAQEKHGDPRGAHRHLGDFGNIEVPVKKASGPIELRIPNPSDGSQAWDALIGRALVIHAKADDLKSSPAGDSGERIACGVIQRARP